MPVGAERTNTARSDRTAPPATTTAVGGETATAPPADPSGSAARAGRQDAASARTRAARFMIGLRCGRILRAKAAPVQPTPLLLCVFPKGPADQGTTRIGM